MQRILKGLTMSKSSLDYVVLQDLTLMSDPYVFLPLALQNYMEQHPSNRNAAIQAAFATGNYTMARLAEHFKLHYTSVSRIVKLA